MNQQIKSAVLQGGAKTQRVAVIFRRFGPYHVARLREAGKLMELHAIEYAAKDDTYAWSYVKENETYQKHVINEKISREYGNIQSRREKLKDTLSNISPVAVAIPGWSMEEALIGLEWCLEHSVPAIVMSESNEMDEERKWLKEVLKGIIVSQFEAGLVGGKLHKDYLIKLGMASDCIFYGYDVVDNDYFFCESEKIQEKDDIIRQKYNLPKKYFLASARFIEKKNLLRLLDAYKLYLDKTRKCHDDEPTSLDNKIWRLVILGDGPMRSQIKEKIKSNGITENVILPGFIQYNELPIYYGLANAFIHVSTVEQWGLVVNEAMASGLPVIVSKRCGCCTELVKHEVNGYEVNPFDTHNIADAMIKLTIMTEDKIQIMGEESLRMISIWGPDKYAVGLMNAVNKCVNRADGKKKPLIRTLIKLLYTFKKK